jgi:hypothetical protein
MLPLGEWGRCDGRGEQVIPRQLPDYVERGGRQVYRPPYIARTADLYGFAVTGNRDKIDDLLDRDLNEPAGGEVQYRCASDTVFFTFADIQELTSVDPPDSGYGFVAENELSVWCLASDLIAGNRLVWYLPYVFTDRGQAIATGREVYGYPKQSATVTMDSKTWSAQAWVIGTHGAAAKASLQPVVTVTHETGSPTRILPGRPKDLPQKALVDNLLTTPLGIKGRIAPGGTPKPSATLTGAATPAPPPANPGGAWVRTPVTKVLDINLDFDRVNTMVAMAADPRLVFLKQFRDVECPTKACYQAIVEAGLKVHVDMTDPLAFELLKSDEFTLAIDTYASHPIREELGVEATQSCTAAFRASLDFTIQTGFEVWRAPT